MGEQNYLQSQMHSGLKPRIAELAHADRHPLADCAKQFIGDGARALRHGLHREFRAPQHGGVADATSGASVTSTPIMSIERDRPADTHCR